MQTVPVTQGQRYRFSIFALRNIPKDAHDAASVELRLDGTLDGHPVTLNSTTTRGNNLNTSDRWTPLTVDGTALGENMRCASSLSPPPTPPRGGAIKFDDAALNVLGN